MAAGETAKHKGERGMKLYEAVDATSDEAYYAIGLFVSLDDAVSSIMADGAPWEWCETAMFDGDEAVIEIRERETGIDPLECGKLVWRRKWVRQYDEEADDFKMVPEKEGGEG